MSGKSKSKKTEGSDLPVQLHPGAVVLPPKSDDKELTSAEKAQKVAIQEIGAAIVRGTVEVAVKYRELVGYIREHTVAPKLVTAWLTPLGFARSRISEIKKVADAPDKVYSAFIASEIGFKNALQLTRDAIEVVATVTDGDANTPAMMEIAEGQHQAEVEAEEKADATPKDKKVQNVLALKSAAHKAIRTVIAMKKKNYTLLLDGYQLTIRKVAKAGQGVETQPAE